MSSTILSVILNPWCYAILASLALGIIRNAHKQRQRHKKARPIRKQQAQKPIMSNDELDFINTMYSIESSKRQLIQQYPVLLTYINNGYIIDSIEPLELRHKDRPYE